MRYIISYDISDDKRRRLIVKRLMKSAHRIQYSVFEAELSGAEQRGLWRDLNGIVDPDQDGLLMIPLCMRCRQNQLRAGTTGVAVVDERAVI